jgi:hypothetical protein
MPITLNGDTGITTPTYGGSVTAEYSVPVTAFKNRIINGAMMIDQRNAGASVTPTVDNSYAVDRFALRLAAASKYSAQRNAGSVTPPAGFTNYLGITSLSAYAVASSDSFAVQQKIEGFNIADLGWGTANAQTVTLSFWVRSSLTGTFGGAILNSAGNRSYAYNYTISSANTWEQKTITIAGDTTGTWLTDNNIGMFVSFGLGTGTSLSGTPNSWQASALLNATGATSVVGTSGATFYITGVQLEKGSTATSFDYRPYPTELQLCQRYFIRYPQGSIVGNGLADGGTNLRVVNAITPVTMRTNPSVSWNNVVTYSGNLTNYGFTGLGGTILGPSSVKFDGVLSSAAPTNTALCLIADGASSFFQMSAEL